MGQSEIQERVAKLNTQLRFGKFNEALVEAYRLRTYLQLSGVKSEEAARELQRVEKVIVELEGRQARGIQKLVNSIVRTAKASLNPTEEESRETLLDRFAVRPESAATAPAVIEEPIVEEEPVVDEKRAFEEERDADSSGGW